MDKKLLDAFKVAKGAMADLKGMVENYYYLDYAEWLIDHKTRADAFKMLSLVFGEDYAQDMLCEANACINAIERKLLVGDKIPETEVTKRFEEIVKKNLGVK